jgi:hypothetical protein
MTTALDEARRRRHPRNHIRRSMDTNSNKPKTLSVIQASKASEASKGNTRRPWNPATDPVPPEYEWIVSRPRLIPEDDAGEDDTPSCD